MIMQNIWVKFTSYLKYRFYVISDNIFFPKMFLTYSFNWNKSKDLIKYSDKQRFYTPLPLYLTYYTSFNSNSLYSFLVKLKTQFNSLYIYFLYVFKTSCGDGFVYIRGLFIILFVDALIADDEPI